MYSIKAIRKMNSVALLKAEERVRNATKNCLDDPFFGVTILSLILVKEHIDNLCLLKLEIRKRGLGA